MPKEARSSIPLSMPHPPDDCGCGGGASGSGSGGGGPMPNEARSSTPLASCCCCGGGCGGCGAGSGSAGAPMPKAERSSCPFWTCCCCCCCGCAAAAAAVLLAAACMWWWSSEPRGRSRLLRASSNVLPKGSGGRATGDPDVRATASASRLGSCCSRAPSTSSAGGSPGAGAEGNGVRRRRIGERQCTCTLPTFKHRRCGRRPCHLRPLAASRRCQRRGREPLLAAARL